MKLKQEPTKEKILAALAFAHDECVSDADYETIFDGVCKSNPISYVCLAILADAYRNDQVRDQVNHGDDWCGVESAIMHD